MLGVAWDVLVCAEIDERPLTGGAYEARGVVLRPAVLSPKRGQHCAPIYIDSDEAKHMLTRPGGNDGVGTTMFRLSAGSVDDGRMVSSSGSLVPTAPFKQRRVALASFD